MALLIDTLSWAFLLAGGMAGLVGGVGLLRLPDVYTRVHAAGMTDTACAWLILLGLMLQAGVGLVAVKLVLVVAFLFFTSPTATHALVKAAHLKGPQPKLAPPADKPTENAPS